jgi:photosystem II stability/assembly factor-like uncharacterized protein
MKNTHRLYYIFVLSILFSPFAITAQSIVQLQQGKPTSIRGLSVVDDSVAWISGSKGYISITTDGGKTWDWQQVKGFEKADFRDIEAFSNKEAVIMSSGAPAVILKTIDGGVSWQEKYRNTDTSYFFDAMDFENLQHGFILGDPINGKFLLMETKDGGDTWKVFKNQPQALTDEAAFAASGTCLRTNGTIAIVTGGKAAEVDIAKSNGNWNRFKVPIANGKASQGAFSIAQNKKQLVVVGGDYQKDKIIDSTVCYSSDNGLTWHPADKFPSGFQSCVEFIRGNTFLSTGTSGSNITLDGGKTWKEIDDTSFNVCRKAKRGKLVLLAGNGGKIGILKP